MAHAYGFTREKISVHAHDGSPRKQSDSDLANDAVEEDYTEIADFDATTLSLGEPTIFAPSFLDR
jgi:hypothetical protein